MQRIEQKMRLKLRLQRQQPRLREFGGQSARFDFATRFLGVEVDRLMDGEQCPVG